MPATLSQLKTIDQAFSDIPEIYNGFQNLRDRLVTIALDSEKQFRGRRSVPNFSAVKASKYFAVKWLLDALRTEKPLAVADFLTTRDDAFLAAAIVSAHRARFVGFVNLPWVEAFDALDYAELMKSRGDKVAA